MFARLPRRLATAGAAVLLASTASTAAAAADGTAAHPGNGGEHRPQHHQGASVPVQLLSVNDLHGHLAAGGQIVNEQGEPVEAGQTYRVAANSFLLGGGDGFTVFTKSTDRYNSGPALEAFTAYLGAHSPVSAPATDRIDVRP